jgi:hypothetical protein
MNSNAVQDESGIKEFGKEELAIIPAGLNTDDFQYFPTFSRSLETL